MNQAFIPRIDPRRPYQLTAEGLKRIVLGATSGLRDPMQQAHGHARVAVRSQGPFSERLLVVAHAERGALDEAAREAVAAAAILASTATEVLVAVWGATSEQVGEVLAGWGADRIVCVEDPGFAPERKLAWLARLWQQEAPLQALFPDRGDDADLGRRFACRLKLGIHTGVVEMNKDKVWRRLPGEQLGAYDRPIVSLLARGVADVRLPCRGLGELGSAMDLPAQAEPIMDKGVIASPASSLALEEADLIVSAGNGVTDIPAFAQLAQSLGAATGASRVAVDDGRFTRDKQVGATGKTVQASAYIALGISGAVQHLQGIKACRHVIAVNLDAAAPIVKRADLTIVDDCQSFMAALAGLVAVEKGGA